MNVSTLLNRNSIREQIRDWILLRIGTGDFAPGERLTETAIAGQLGVSPIPVREAIRELVATGILESAVHKGAWVRSVETSETIEALRVRAALEPLAIRMASKRQGEHIDELRRIAAAIVDAAKGDNFATYQRLNHEFHRRIVEIAGSSVLLRVWDSLTYEVNARTVLDSIRAVSAIGVAEEHCEVLDAIEQRAFTRAGGLLAAHTERLAMLLEKNLQEGPTGSTPSFEEKAPKRKKAPRASS